MGLETIELSKSPSSNNNFSKESFLSCWYTNATSLNNKFNDLLLEIDSRKPQIIMICETWWTEASTTNIKGYTLFRRDRIGKRGGGVCIYVNDLIKAYNISN